MRKIRSTKYNIIRLVLLRFAGQKVTTRDIAEFLGITRRQAQTIINELVKLKAAEKETWGIYRIEFMDKKCWEVVLNILRYIGNYIEEELKRIRTFD